jgi:hypothetical protein
MAKTASTVFKLVSLLFAELKAGRPLGLECLKDLNVIYNI